jgi:hypothetical protein
MKKTADGHYVDDDGRRYLGVTTVLGVINKPGLPNWYARIASETGDAAAPDRVRSGLANRGTRLHAAFDNILHDWPTDDDDADVDALRRLVGSLEIKPICTETVVVDYREQYAGRVDALVRIGHGVWLVDLKTGKNIYPEAFAQLAAYRNASLPAQFEEPDHCGFIHLRDGRAVLQLVTNKQLNLGWDLFLTALDMYRHLESLRRTL